MTFTFALNGIPVIVIVAADIFRASFLLWKSNVIMDKRVKKYLSPSAEQSVR